MRRGVLAFVLINVVLVAYLLFSVWTLLSLLLVDGSEDAISRAELPGPGSEDQLGGKRELIPKIIHQTYANTSIPPVWKSAQASCIDLHPDYEYKLWTDESAREFIAAEYPWFLDTFDGYTYNIQRADAIRYFVLAHFGGIYIDMDDGCQRRLDPLLTYPAWLRRTAPTGISNDVMGSVPRHPFFLKVIDALPLYNRNWFLPYITVMGSTGPLFLSVLWRHHVNSMPSAWERVHILFPEEYSKTTWSFFKYNKGDSWHQADVQLIMWMARNWVFLTVLGFIFASIFFSGMWFVYGRVVKHFSIQTRPGSKSFPRTFFFRRANLSFWRRLSMKNENYELLRGYSDREYADRLEA